VFDNSSFISNGRNGAIAMVGARDKEIDGLHSTLVMWNHL